MCFHLPHEETMRQLCTFLLLTTIFTLFYSQPATCLQFATGDTPLTPVIVTEVTSPISGDQVTNNVTTAGTFTSPPPPPSSILVPTSNLVPNFIPPNSTFTSPPTSTTTETLEDFDNLLNVTSELQLEKVNKDEECLRQLFISDKCLKKVIFLAKDSSLPRSLDEATTYCDAIQETVECVSQYKRCLNSFPKTLFGLLIKDVRATLKDICEDDQSKQQMVESLRCFNDTIIFRKILDGWTNILNYIADEVPIESHQILPNLCCSYQYTVEINRRALEKLCGPEMSSATNAWIKQMINSMVKSAFDFGCTRHNSIESCKFRLPRSFRLYKSLTIDGRRNPLPITPVVPLLKLITKLNTP